MKLIKEKPNTKYGNWVVLKFHKISPHGDARWFCKCELCSNVYSVDGFTLRNGRSTKCKCCARRLRRDRTI